MLKNRFYIFSIIISLIGIQLMMWAIFLNLQLLPPEVPLYYFKPWGEERLAPAQSLWLIPVASSITFIVNFLLATYFYKYRKERFIAQILMVCSSFISILGLIFLYRILSLVTP